MSWHSEHTSSTLEGPTGPVKVAHGVQQCGGVFFAPIRPVWYGISGRDPSARPFSTTLD
jgi:hypothetical protein